MKDPTLVPKDVRGNRMMIEKVYEAAAQQPRQAVREVERDAQAEALAKSERKNAARLKVLQNVRKLVP